MLRTRKQRSKALMRRELANTVASRSVCAQNACQAFRAGAREKGALKRVARVLKELRQRAIRRP